MRACQNFQKTEAPPFLMMDSCLCFRPQSTYRHPLNRFSSKIIHACLHVIKNLVTGLHLAQRNTENIASDCLNHLYQRFGSCRRMINLEANCQIPTLSDGLNHTIQPRTTVLPIVYLSENTAEINHRQSNACTTHSHTSRTPSRKNTR